MHMGVFPRSAIPRLVVWFPILVFLLIFLLGIFEFSSLRCQENWQIILSPGFVPNDFL